MNDLSNEHAFGWMDNDILEEHFSNFLIDSWSYSKVQSFSRNEKEFEMRYIYYCSAKISSTTVAGSAYHRALEFFFNGIMSGEKHDIVLLEQAAFKYIDEVEAHKWKLQKTTPTIEECRNNAYKVVSALIRNFISEVDVYLSKIKKVVYVEVKTSQWLTVNGVDIPLPVNLVIDMVVETIDGKKALVDHKSKRSLSDEKDLTLTVGKQAITYTLGYEAMTGEKVDEVWFIENKYSKNKNNNPQLNLHCVTMDKDTRALYESMLYEPLKRMVEAVSDPDYVYLINDNDSFSDKAELFEFWSKTMIAEVDDFNIPENKKELVKKRLKKIRDASLGSITPNVIKNFQDTASSFITYDLSNKNMTNQEKITHTFRTLGISVDVPHIFEGFSSNTYLIEASAGVPLSKLQRYKLDIANALGVSSIRIMKELFVHNDRSYVAVESPKKRDKDLLWDKKYLDGMNIPIGVDNFNNTIYWDIDNHSTPHMLICGATGSGKSVSIYSTIEYAIAAGIDDIVIFDPKFEFINKGFSKKVRIYSSIEEIEEEMKDLVELMNEKIKKGSTRKTLVVFDEFADAVSQSRKGKELDIIEEVQIGTYAPKKVKGLFGESVEPGLPKMAMKKVGQLKSLEENLKILLQKGRSSGFRVISATQRASVKVITGDAKVNFPVQICFRVPKEVDSKVVIDEPGAESLNGYGDGLIKSPEYFDVIRFQGFFKPN